MQAQQEKAAFAEMKANLAPNWPYWCEPRLSQYQSSCRKGPGDELWVGEPPSRAKGELEQRGVARAS